MAQWLFHTELTYPKQLEVVGWIVVFNGSHDGCHTRILYYPHLKASAVGTYVSME